MRGALSGIRVIERAMGSAAAYAGRLLAVCGAEVLMLEPAGGTPLRREAPFIGESKTSALFAYLSAGKDAVPCDLSNAEDKAKFEDSLRSADVLLDDTPVTDRPGLGLDPERVTRDFPNLVFVSVLPFGAFGPRAHWCATELNSFHSGGEGYLMPNGLAIELFPNRPPVKIYGQFANFQGGTAAAIAAVAALVSRPLAGGQFVDVSIQDANVAESTVAIQRWADGVLEMRSTRSFRYGGVLECADGYVEVLTLEQHQWDALVALMGRPGWAESPAFKDALERGKHGDEINQHLRAWAKRHRVVDVVRRGRELGVPIAAYASPADVLCDPHERERGLFVKVRVEGAGIVEMPLAPFRFSATPAQLRTPARA